MCDGFSMIQYVMGDDERDGSIKPMGKSLSRGGIDEVKI